jgi:inactivated superfamily I helicase
MLQGLIRRRIAQAAMHRLHGLPLAVVEQPVEIPSRRLALRPPTEADAELIDKRPEALQDLAGVAIVHARYRRESGSSVQVRNLGSRCTNG